MTTLVPPAFGPYETLSDDTDMTGQYVHKFKPVAEVYVLDTTTSPVPFDVPGPVTTVICVRESTVKLVTASPLNVTEFTEKKPAPVITTVVPPTRDPFETSSELTDMGG
jgi:hypothetical protein